MAVVSTPWQWQFPECVLGASIGEQINRVHDEVCEAVTAYIDEGDERVAEELMDVIHAAETALRMLEAEENVDLDFEKRYVVLKNDGRGYYG